MPRPAYMQLVDIELRKLVKTVEIDSDFREYSGTPQYGPIIKLKGQPNFMDAGHYFNQRRPSRTGDKEHVVGHIVFGANYLCRAGVQVEKGDIVVSIAGMNTEAFSIGEVRPEAPFRGKFLLLYAELERRSDSK